MPKKIAADKVAKQTVKAIRDYPIYCIYLYYFDDHGLRLQYEIVDRNTAVFDIGYSSTQVEASITDVIKRSVIDQTIPYYCDEQDSMHMRRKSIVVYAVEPSGTMTQNGPITFSSYKGNDGTHTFINPAYFIKRIAGRTFYVTYCLNLMKSPYQVDLGNLDYEVFRIELPYQKKGGKEGRDPGTGGTNMGPPVGPPDRKKEKKR